jgi:hypothetical protein
MNLNGGIISSESEIMVLNNSSTILNGNITFDGKAKLSLGKRFSGINSTIETHELLGLNE